MSDFDLEITTGREILIYLNLCRGWKNLVQSCSIDENYKKSLEEYANKMARFAGLEKATLRWNDEWGLTTIDVHYGDACGLLLERDLDSSSYYPHNVDTPEQAFTLIATTLKYIWNIRVSSANKIPNWAIQPIGIGPTDVERQFQELWIKINLHPNLEEIVKHSNSSKKFRNFIEECAPFSEQGYKKLKEIKFNWDKELGLRSVAAYPSVGSGEGLNIERDASGNFYYFAHNVKYPIQAVALIGAVSKYMQHLKRIEEAKA